MINETPMQSQTASMPQPAMSSKQSPLESMCGQCKLNAGAVSHAIDLFDQVLIRMVGPGILDAAIGDTPAEMPPSSHALLGGSLGEINIDQHATAELLNRLLQRIHILESL